MLVAYCWLFCHCHNLAEGGCLLSQFHFMRCCYFLGHVACRDLPWQGLSKVHIVLLAMNGPLAAELKFRGNAALVGRIA